MPTISKTRFVIAVPDLKLSAAFYRDVLGFGIHALSDPGWLLYTSGECTIMAGECPDAIPPRKLGDHSYFAYLQIDEIDPFYASVVALGAEISKTIRDEPWGMREFGLATVDGHRIMFAAAGGGKKRSTAPLDGLSGAIPSSRIHVSGSFLSAPAHLMRSGLPV